MAHRYEMHAQALAEAGLAGKSMQAKLAEIIAGNDLNEHEIRRICEDANRSVHLSLVKQAHATGGDARIKFPLAVPEEGVKHARKLAEASLVRNPSLAEKLASVSTIEGDAFAAPDDLKVASAPLSLYGIELDPSVAAFHEESESRKLLSQLKIAAWEVEELIKEAAKGEIAAMGDAYNAHDRAVQAALEMVLTGGIKLPDIYMALFAAVSGNRSATEEDRTGARELLDLVIAGLKKRGIPNSRMGFRVGDRSEWNPRDFDKLSAKEIAELCERAVNVTAGTDAPAKLATKYFITSGTGPAKNDDTLESAEKWLSERASLNDDKYTVPLHDGENKVQVVDGNAEFVIAIKDLVGARDRVMTMHNTQEYMGTKLKQIEDQASGVQKAQAESSSQRDRENKDFDERKEAFLPALMAGANALGALGTVASVAAPLMGGKSNGAAAPAMPKPKAAV